MPTAATRAVIGHQSVSDAVRLVAANCAAPALVTLTAAGASVTGRRETVPGGPLSADTAPTTLAGMARLITRHPGMFDPNVYAYAVVLPTERVAFAADRDGRGHAIQLPGAPTEPLRGDRWDAIRDGLTAMINALP